jgi:hypothetical protein
LLFLRKCGVEIEIENTNSMEIESNHVGIASKLIFYGFYFGTITSNIKFRVI